MKCCRAKRLWKFQSTLQSRHLKILIVPYCQWGDAWSLSDSGRTSDFMKQNCNAVKFQEFCHRTILRLDSNAITPVLSIFSNLYASFMWHNCTPFYGLPQLSHLFSNGRSPSFPLLLGCVSPKPSILLPENSSPKRFMPKKLISLLYSRQPYQDATENQRAWTCVFLWKLLPLLLPADSLLLSIAFPCRLLSEWQTSERTRRVWKEQKPQENPEALFHSCRE